MRSSSMPLTRRKLLSALPAAWVVPAQAAAQPLAHEPRRLFGGPCQVRCAAQTDLRVLDRVWAGFTAMDRRWNAWKPQGLAPLNHALREGRSVQVDPALRRLIEGAARLEAWTDGHFNAGIGGLVQTWGFQADRLQPQGAQPTPRQLARWGRWQPSLSQLRWQGLTLRSLNPAVQLDFGGYAKGVAIDWALDVLQAAGVRDAVVDLGGNLAALGGAEGGSRPWQVGIRDPWGDGVMAQLPTGPREAVVTSGVYERQRLLDGEPCSHVLDPARLRPVRGLRSVTVVHRQAGLADAAATALLVAGPGRWAPLARRLALHEVLVVHDDGHAEALPRLAARLTMATGWQARLRTV